MSLYLKIWLHRILFLFSGCCSDRFHCKQKQGYRLSVSDKVYQSLAYGRWFSSSTPAFSTTKTGRHDIAEILLKVALKHQKNNQSIEHLYLDFFVLFTLIGILLCMNSFSKRTISNRSNQDIRTKALQHSYLVIILPTEVKISHSLLMAS